MQNFFTAHRDLFEFDDYTSFSENVGLSRSLVRSQATRPMMIDPSSPTRRSLHLDALKPVYDPSFDLTFKSPLDDLKGKGQPRMQQHNNRMGKSMGSVMPVKQHEGATFDPSSMFANYSNDPQVMMQKQQQPQPHYQPQQQHLPQESMDSAAAAAAATAQPAIPATPPRARARGSSALQSAGRANVLASPISTSKYRRTRRSKSIIEKIAQAESHINPSIQNIYSSQQQETSPLGKTGGLSWAIGNDHLEGMKIALKAGTKFDKLSATSTQFDHRLWAAGHKYNNSNTAVGMINDNMPRREYIHARFSNPTSSGGGDVNLDPTKRSCTPERTREYIFKKVRRLLPPRMQKTCLSGYMNDLPECVKNRLVAFKKLPMRKKRLEQLMKQDEAKAKKIQEARRVYFG